MRRKSKKNGHAANLSTLVLLYGDFEPKFALCGQIKPPFFEDDSYMHAQACTCALQFLKLPPKNPIRVVFNQACKYAPTGKKICKGEVISPFLGLLFGFNLVAHILFKKEYIEFFFKQFQPMLIQVLIPLKQWMGQNFKNMAPSMRQLSHFLTF